MGLLSSGFNLELGLRTGLVNLGLSSWTGNVRDIFAVQLERLNPNNNLNLIHLDSSNQLLLGRTERKYGGLRHNLYPMLFVDRAGTDILSSYFLRI